ncbi:hypothetical protein DPX16_2185 [Anabarilius grahami]|uniref:Uncharacterized protein n=1 Tax=Anabarilius grahami TaxID=495550 RepID=A0A3N0YS10_ANAGA|nr:hypothetical protein DPX16_2185 [Anabarilius grahami]
MKVKNKERDRPRCRAVRLHQTKRILPSRSFTHTHSVDTTVFVVRLRSEKLKMQRTGCSLYTRAARYLATGDSYTTIASSYRVGISIVAGIVPEVSKAIWDSLVDDFLPVPKTADWQEIATGFKERWNSTAEGPVPQEEQRIPALTRARRVGTNNSTQEAIAVQESFNRYFSSATGEVPWQHNIA